MLNELQHFVILKLSFLSGYPVSRSEQEILSSQPIMSQQFRRVRPPPCKPRLRYLSRSPQGLLVPPSSLLHSTHTLHPLHPDSCLQRTMVRPSSQPVKRASGTGAASAGEHLSASGPLPHPTGPYSRAPPSAGFPCEQRNAEVS